MQPKILFKKRTKIWVKFHSTDILSW